VGKGGEGGKGLGWDLKGVGGREKGRWMEG